MVHLGRFLARMYHAVGVAVVHLLAFLYGLQAVLEQARTREGRGEDGVRHVILDRFADHIVGHEPVARDLVARIVEGLVRFDRGLHGFRGQRHASVPGIHGDLRRIVFETALLGRLLRLHVLGDVVGEHADLAVEHIVRMAVIRVELDVIPILEHVYVHVRQHHLVPFVHGFHDGPVGHALDDAVHLVLEHVPREVGDLGIVLETEAAPGGNYVQGVVVRQMELDYRDAVGQRVVGHHRRVHAVDVLVRYDALVQSLVLRDVQTAPVGAAQFLVEFHGQLGEQPVPFQVLLVALALADEQLHGFPGIAAGRALLVPGLVHPVHGHGHDQGVTLDVFPVRLILQVYLVGP